jgi:hypothetical protein
MSMKERFLTYLGLTEQSRRRARRRPAWLKVMTLGGGFMLLLGFIVSLFRTEWRAAIASLGFAMLILTSGFASRGERPTQTDG